MISVRTEVVWVYFVTLNLFGKLIVFNLFITILLQSFPKDQVVKKKIAEDLRTPLQI